MIYAIAFIAAMFLSPCLIVGGWAMLIDRVPFTERGLNLGFLTVCVSLGVVAALFGFILPTPYSA
jgi:hypothetical protein